MKTKLVMLSLIMALGCGYAMADSTTSNTHSSESGAFVPYYPNGCSMTGGKPACDCIKNKKTGDIWDTSLVYQKGKTWTAANTYVNGYNTSNHCGLSSGWTLPNRTQQNELINSGGIINLMYQYGFVYFKSKLATQTVFSWGVLCSGNSCPKTNDNSQLNAEIYQLTPTGGAAATYIVGGGDPNNITTLMFFAVNPKN